MLPDYSVWRAWWRTLRRQGRSLLGRRRVSPPDCPLLPMTARMLRWIWIYRREMRGSLLELAERERARGKTILRWRTPREMRHGLALLRAGVRGVR